MTKEAAFDKYMEDFDKYMKTFDKYMEVFDETIKEMTVEDIIKKLKEFEKLDEDIKNIKYKLVLNNKKED